VKSDSNLLLVGRSSLCIRHCCLCLQVTSTSHGQPSSTSCLTHSINLCCLTHHSSSLVSDQRTWRRLRFDEHFSAMVQRATTTHSHLLTMDLAQTIACSLILSRIDYCNAVLHGAPSTSCSRYRITPEESFIKCEDDHTHTCCEGTALVAGGAINLL